MNHPLSGAARKQTNQALKWCLPFALGLVLSTLGCGDNSTDDVTFDPGSSPARGGYAVAVDGDIIVIGSELDSEEAEDAGDAIVYRFDGFDWNREARLVASDAVADARFGITVAVDSDEEVIVVATLDDQGAIFGSVYVFRYDGMDWIEEQTLLPGDSVEADTFVAAIAIDGDEIVVGAEDSLGGTGYVYVYRFDGDDWIHEQSVSASAPATAKFFGGSLDLDGDVLVVGAFGSSEAGQQSGSAYVFRFDVTDYAEEQVLTAGDADAQDAYGFTVAVSSDAIVVGSLLDDDDGPDTGSAYVYRFAMGAWGEEQKLTALDPEIGQHFGVTSDIDGDVIALGADLADGAGFFDAFAGAVYVFRFDGMDWIEEQVLSDGGSAAGELFGSSLSLDGDIIAVGTFDDFNFGFVFRYVDPDWAEEQVLDPF